MHLWKGDNKFGQGIPPPSFRPNPKEQLTFFAKPSLTCIHFPLDWARDGILGWKLRKLPTLLAPPPILSSGIESLPHPLKFLPVHLAAFLRICCRNILLCTEIYYSSYSSRAEMEIFWGWFQWESCGFLGFPGCGFSVMWGTKLLISPVKRDYFNNLIWSFFQPLMASSPNRSRTTVRRPFAIPDFGPSLKINLYWCLNRHYSKVKIYTYRSF